MGLHHLISRRARVTVCPRCQRTTLVAIDEGIPVSADPIPLTVAGEISAWMDAVPCFAFTDGGQLAHRDAGRITTSSKYGRPLVVATHRCARLPHPDHVDTTRVPRLAAYIEARTREPPDAGDDALFTVRDLLAGRVIAHTDHDEPPF